MALHRPFYETSYHFEDDVLAAGEARLWEAMRLLEPLAGTTFLDLGSGVGWAAHLAGQRGGATTTIGLDFAWKPLRLGAEAIPGVRRVQGDGCHLPLRSGSVDRVLSFGSVEHFPDVALGLREVRRVLRTDGTAVIVVPNFYVRTEQPREIRQGLGGGGGELSTRPGSTGAGPQVFRDRRPARIVFRLGAKALSVVPGLQYQFIFQLRPQACARRRTGPS